MNYRPPLRTSLVTLIDREVEALDGLLAELRLGPRDQRHYDALEERAQAIGAGIVAAFRKGQR